MTYLQTLFFSIRFSTIGILRQAPGRLEPDLADLSGAGPLAGAFGMLALWGLEGRDWGILWFRKIVVFDLSSGFGIFLQAAKHSI